MNDETERIQRAIDAGGHVRIERGVHLVRTLHLRSGTTLELAAGSVLHAHPENNAFDLQERPAHETHADVETSDFAHALLVGRDLDDVAIVGAGTIDLDRAVRWGPKPIALRECRGVRIEGVTIRRAPNYAISLGACDDVVVGRVTIRDSLSDGIDPDSCRRVRVVDCDVESDDDAICVKTSLFLGEPRACEDIEVARCRMRSGTNGFKIGTETSGPVRRVRVTDCDIDARPRDAADPRHLDLHDLHEAGGVSIETVDGADVEDVVVERVRVSHANAPLFVRRGARGRGQPAPRPGVCRGVVVRELTAVETRATSSITGVPGSVVERVRLERVRVEGPGGGRRRITAVPELADAYPQCTMFGPLPAWGLYARHVVDLALDEVTFTVREPDEREMIVSDDVTFV